VADQKSRGGKKRGGEQPDHPEQAEGTNTEGAGERSEKDKRKDQQSNTDDDERTPTNEQR
jgi:hypothetical protein